MVLFGPGVMELTAAKVHSGSSNSSDMMIPRQGVSALYGQVYWHTPVHFSKQLAPLYW